MKRHNTDIDRLVRKLREDQADKGVETAVQAFSPVPVASRRITTSAWAWRAAAVAGCAILLAAGVLWPRESSAAASFDRLVTAQRRSTVMFHVQPYWVTRGELTPKIWSGFVWGNRWRYVQDNFEQSYDGVRTLTYQHFSSETSATTELGSEHGTGEVLQSAFLDKFMKKSPQELKLEHGVTWRGRRVDKYVSRFSFTDEKGARRIGVSTLYADPVRGLPLYFEDIHSPTKGSALEWTYIEPAQEGLLQIKLPKGLRVRDITGERKVVPLGAPQQAKAEEG